MADIGAVVLHKILKEKSLDGWSKLKLSFFNAAFSSVYSAVNKYYNRYNRIPDFADLDLYIRDNTVKQSIQALSILEVPDMDLDIAIDALVNEYTQNEALKLIDHLVTEITLMECQEVKDSISSMAIQLDERTHTSTSVVNSDNISIFEAEENIAHTKVFLGFSNTFDAEQEAHRSDLIVVGGKRGHGKSVWLCNVATNQYEQGDVGAYFTIEMRAHEIFQRQMAILAKVSAKNLRQNRLTDDEIIRIAEVRANMFVDGFGHYKDFLDHRDKFKFEAQLLKNCKLKEGNQLVIIDDPVMTIPSIDVHLQKLKAKFGNKLKAVALDYINVISLIGDTKNYDKYDWKPQIAVSAKLKELAAKHDVVVASAMQIDDENKIRFAKGILDSPDLAYILDAYTPADGCMGLDNTKVRSGPKLDLCVGINWDTLRINPTDVERPNKTKIKKEKAVPGAKEDDLPF